jgi:hypothetical protein
LLYEFCVPGGPLGFFEDPRRGSVWEAGGVCWSLPENGPIEVIAFRAKRDEEMMRSMVEDFPDEGLILVPRSFGVIIVASGWSVITEQMDLPAVLSVELDSHRLWWALRSPAIMKGIGGANKRFNSSGEQSPLGE